jgi:hypothetical protein
LRNDFPGYQFRGAGVLFSREKGDRGKGGGCPVYRGRTWLPDKKVVLEIDGKRYPDVAAVSDALQSRGLGSL